MTAIYDIVASVLALALLGAAAGKLARAKQVVASITGVGVPLKYLPALAACEAAGAVGLIVGIWWAPLGIAAAIGVVLYFIGAIGAHIRAHDLKGLPPAVVLLIVGAVALVLRLAS